ncbi:hypothetical protein HY256_06315 [Candidatus Sumerlaeota bacterium]|nr:hypothetical protein [Candidatus Sumerlaeota bacterium]
MMDDQARPYLIDFATAVHSKPGLLGLPFRMLFRRYAVVDRYQMAQMKADFYPMNLTPEEENLLRHPPGYLKYGRFVKKYVLRWRKPRHRKRYLRSIKKKIRRLTGSKRKEE